MIDPRIVVEAALPLLSSEKPLAGKHVLITSGGNREPIDPVRYIGNRSSGKMGRALVLEALARGASVTVVQGPSEVQAPYGAEVIPVETAAEMAEAVMARVSHSDIIIGAAAVADYRVANAASAKIKRAGESLVLTLVENPDILAQVGATKREGQLLVGFAAETDNMLENASAKLNRKRLDLIVANRVGAPDSDFGKETINAALIHSGGVVNELPLLSKAELAEKIFDVIVSL
jgi:phosphopantothenoylcysteine decarboxylase/phosphopantothenate--cysteine ligase